QRSLSPFGCPPFQIPQIDHADGALRQPELPGHSSRRRTLARLPHSVFEPLGIGRLAGNLLDLLHLRSALHTVQPMDLDHHRNPELEAVQIRNLTLPGRNHRVRLRIWTASSSGLRWWSRSIGWTV